MEEPLLIESFLSWKLLKPAFWLLFVPFSAVVATVPRPSELQAYNPECSDG